MSNLSPVAIDVVSDAVCPWCYLGKRRLEQALTMLPEIPTEVRWRPFQLDPTIPPEGMPRDEYIRRKFGSPEALDTPNAHLTQTGAAAGIAYAFDKIKRSPNTIDAHRLIRWAGEAGIEDAMVEHLFQLYFSEGADIGDRNVLVQVAKDVGMDAAAIARDLATERDRDTIQDSIAVATEAGITGVPCFIFDRQFAVMGAQSAEHLAAAIRKAVDGRAAAQV